MIVSLITTLVNYVKVDNHTIFINLSIIINVISLTFLEILGIILVINQWKLKESSKQNKKILILYFLGLFFIIPTIFVIMKDSRFNSKKTSKNKITSNKNISVYAIYSFLYILCLLYFFPILISILLTSCDALTYYITHSFATFFCCILYIVFLLIVLELINIKLIIQSIKLEKKYPKEIKKLWICHLLGFALIIPNLIIIFVMWRKCKKIINKKENENVTNLSFSTNINNSQFNHTKVNTYTKQEIADAKGNIDFFERASSYYNGFLIIFIFGLAILLFLVIYYHPCPVFYYIMPLIFTIGFWIIISIIGFYLTVLQAKIELAFPDYVKKICILFLLGLLLIIPTIIGIHITRKTCEKIMRENKWE